MEVCEVTASKAHKAAEKPASSPAAGTSTKTQKPAQAFTYTIKSGYLHNHGTILKQTMTPKEDEAKCNALPACKGFSCLLNVSDPAGECPVYFKDISDMGGTLATWTSGIKAAPVA